MGLNATWSLRDVADETGVHHSTLHRFLKGKAIISSDVDTLARWAFDLPDEPGL